MQSPTPAVMSEREAFITWVTTEYPNAWHPKDAAYDWDNSGVTSLAWQAARASLSAQAAEPVEHPRISERDIERWNKLICESPEGPWVMGNGGSFDRTHIHPISDEMLLELSLWLRQGYTPWNGRSMPLSAGDRQFMYMLYFSVQGLISRMRAAEKAASDVRLANTSEEPILLPSGNVLVRCAECVAYDPDATCRQCRLFVPAVPPPATGGEDAKTWSPAERPWIPGDRRIFENIVQHFMPAGRKADFLKTMRSDTGYRVISDYTEALESAWHEWQAQCVMAASAGGDDARDAAMFRWAYSGAKTESHALVELGVRILNNELPTLDEVRSVYAAAMAQEAKP